MSNFGIPYQGSKDILVHKLAAILPKADNLYDLFGGGFSVSHYMHLFGDYKTVHYNELEPSTVELVKDAIAGKYNYKSFKPEWITRQMFHARKQNCAYTRIVWSFGNNQNTYIFGKNIEEYKRSLHQAVVFSEFNKLAIDTLGLSKWPDHLSIRGRRLLCRNQVFKKNGGQRGDKQLEQLKQFQQLQQLERLEQLQQLQHLQRLERLQRLQQLEPLTMTSLSYEQVQIKPNSIIYCDPPYKNTFGYTKSFDHDSFWQWVRSCPHPVYVSEYSAPDDIKTIAAFRHSKTNSKTRTQSVEKLFWNGV